MLELHTVANREELGRWLPSIVALTRAEAEREGSRILIQGASFYDRFCEERGRTIVACLGGDLVGMSLMAFGDAIHACYEVDLARLGVDRSEVAVGVQSLVGAAWRRRGIARALLRHRSEIARALGRRYILSTTDPENRAMLALYASLGSRELDRRRVYSMQVMRVIMSQELACSLSSP